MKRGAWIVSGLAALVVAGLSVAGFSLMHPGKAGQSGQDITLASCRPHNLKRVEACWGRDESFQECRLYYAATGVPDPAFCRDFSATYNDNGAPAGCTLDSPSGWVDVNCKDYSLDEWAHCHACKTQTPEAVHGYVYAYNATCTRAIEQVTCNFDSHQAGSLLKKSRPKP